MPRVLPISVFITVSLVSCASPDPEPGARHQPGTEMGLYTPQQHDLYDGRFVLTGNRIFQVGTLADATPWDHMGNDASNVRSVAGTVQIDVNEIDNTGTFRAELHLPEGSTSSSWSDSWSFRHARMEGSPRFCSNTATRVMAMPTGPKVFCTSPVGEPDRRRSTARCCTAITKSTSW